MTITHEEVQYFKMKSVRFSVLVIAVAVLIIGLSGCDQLLDIISDGDMPQIDSDVPQLEGLHGEISIGVVYPSPTAAFE